MKRYVTIILLFSLLLTGCASKGKMKEYAKEKVEEKYGIEVKAVQIERSNIKGPLIFAFFSIFSGNYYDLTFETKDDPSVIFKGSIQSRNFNLFSEGYICSKHEWLMQHDSAYSDLYKILEKNGFDKITLSSGFTKNVKGNIVFTGQYDGDNANVDELFDTMNKMAGMMIEKQKPYEVSITFKAEADMYDDHEFKQKSVEYSIYSYGLPPGEDVHSILAKQLDIYHSRQNINEELVSKLNKWGFGFSSELRVDYGKGPDQRWYEHEIILPVRAEYDVNQLLKATSLLSEYGMDEASVRLLFKEGSTEECRVKDLQDRKGIERCFHY